MIYYSHSKKDENNAVYGSKQLVKHINGVKEKAFFHLHHNVDLGYSKDELKELLRIIVDLHDFGKYTSYFQNYLLDIKPINSYLKRHSQFGGFVAFNLLEKQQNKKGLIALYLIFLHHSSLIDIQDISMKLGNDLKRIFEKQKESIN